MIRAPFGVTRAHFALLSASGAWISMLGCGGGNVTDSETTDAAGPSTEVARLPEYDNCVAQQLSCDDYLVPESCSCDSARPLAALDCVAAGFFLCDRAVLISSANDPSDANAEFDVKCRCAERVTSADECASTTQFRCSIYQPQRTDCLCDSDAPLDDGSCELTCYEYDPPIDCQCVER